MAFDVEGALKAGYSEQEVANFLGQQNKFDTQAAIASGYSPREVISHLASGASTSRTWGEAAKDVGAGLTSGLGSLVQLPGQLYGLATGNFAPTGLLGTGEAISKYGTEMKSPGLKAREAASEARVKAAEESSGEVAAFVAQAKELITDPAQLTNFLAENLPQMLLPGGAAKLAAKKALASAIAKGVAEDAAKTGAIAAGVTAAKGVGAVQQGADIGAESYKNIYNKLIEQKVPADEAAAKAINLARGAGASAGIISWLAQSLPGASALEAKFAGKTGGPGRLATGLKESLSEMVEEGGGKATQNLAMQDVDPTQRIMQGVGATTARAGVAGAGMGAGLGGQGAAKPAAEAPPVQAPPAQEAIPAAPVPIAERPYPELAKEVARISALADTREATPQEMQDLKAMRAEIKRRKDEGDASSQMEIPEAKPEGPLPPETDLFGKPLLPKATQPEGLADVIGAELPATSEVMRDAGLAPTTKELEAAGQQRLPLRRTPEGKPTTAPIVTPKEAPSVPPSAPAPTVPPVQPRPQPRGSKPSVGVPVQPTGADTVQPGTTGTPGGVAPPVSSGLVPPKQPVAPGVAPAGQPAPALTAETAAPALQTLIDTAGTALAKKRAATTALAALQDPKLNETAEDKAGNLRLAAGVLGRKVAPAAPVVSKPVAPVAAKPAPVTPAGMFGQLVKPGAPDIVEAEAPKPAKPAAPASPFDVSGPSSIAGTLADTAEEAAAKKAATGKKRSVAEPYQPKQTIEQLTAEVTNIPGLAGAAIRRMLKTGKLVLKDASPDGADIGGEFDGRTATLFASGTRPGAAVAVVLHEVGAHLGLKRMLGEANYDIVIAQIKNWATGPKNEARALAQRALARIPAEDIAQGESHYNDEVVAYFVEEVAKAEIAKELPTAGPLRNLWNQIKTHILSEVNRALGTDFGVRDLTPRHILVLAQAAMTRAAATAPEGTAATKKQFSISVSSESLIAGSGAVDPVEVSALRRLINVAKADPGISYVTKFRTYVADIAATIEGRLTAQFDGAVRDSLGNVNPMGLYRQAQDYTKMLLEFFQQGSLTKNPTTGLWEVTTVKGVRPPAEVYALIDKWGKANGWTREEATQKASRLLEAVRLDGLRTANKTQGATFTLHKIDATSPLSIDQQIDQLLTDYRANPELAEMNKLMDESRKALVDHLVTVGRLTPDQGQDWKEVIGYVPFDRLSEKSLEKFSKVKRISGKGLAQVGKLPELQGTTRLAVGNVFNSYIDTMGWMVGQVIKTDGTVQTLRGLEKVTAAKFLGPSHQEKPNTVGMYVKGVRNYWELPSKYDVMAFKDLNPPKEGWLLQLGAFSNVLRKAITALPPFALKQVTDDVQRAILTSGVRNPAALLRMTLTNFPKMAIAELRGIQHPSVREFGAMGLTGEYDFQAGKPAASLLKDMGIAKRSKFEGIMHKLDGVTRASDLAVRKAIYDQTVKEGGDKLLAQTRAREFINFRRRGSSALVGALVTTIPFFNAYVQGMDVLYRAASGKDSSSSVGRAQARQMFWSRAAIVTMLSSLYALGKDDDDEDYKKMDLRTRDSNWILPGGVKMPVPGEFGAVFKVIPERVVEYMRRQGTPEEQEAFEAVRTALTYMYEQYLGRVTPLPQAVKPLLEAWSNQSFLTGRPLEGFHQQPMDRSMRTTDQTSELAKAIANFSRDAVKVEVSPIMIDNLLRGYFGSTAALLTTMTDSLLNPTRVDRPLHKWAFLSNYMYDPVGTRPTTEFYEEREKMGKANATLNDLAKTDMDRAEKYAIEHQDELVFESAINSTLQQLEQTRAYRTFLNSPDGAKELSADEREASLKEVKQYELAMVGWLREAKVEYRKSKF